MRINKQRVCACAASLALVPAMTAQAGFDPLFVDASASPGGNGSSWGEAFNRLQDALAAAEAAGGGTTQIWVADGTYRPASFEGNREASFDLVSGVAVYGGFAGGEDELDDRNPAINIATLSGDVNADDDSPEPAFKDNSYNVVDGSNTDADALIDGFTITAGFADGFFPHDRGAGMVITSGDVRVRNCIFIDNDGGTSGGGIAVQFSDAQIVGCTFVSNEAELGGAISVRGGNPVIANSRFYANTADQGAAVQASAGANLLIVNSIFSGNFADLGGALMNASSTTTIANCTIAYNLAIDEAGGILDSGASAVANISNTILWGNEVTSEPGPPDQDAQFVINEASSVQYSVIQEMERGLPGPGNISDDPLFIDADGKDGLQGTIDDDLHVSSSSPTIDAGSNSAVPADAADLDDDGITAEKTPMDIEELARLHDVAGTPDTGEGSAPIVDMGAYEFGAGPPVDGECPPADLSGDCTVGPSDLAIVLGTWGPCDDPEDCAPDLNGDGTVGPGDLAIVLGTWGATG